MVVSTDPGRLAVLKLIEEKKEIEKKISNFGLILQTNKVGMNEPLTDAEGFPRNDIDDVRSVRIARSQIICLQNDLKEITKSIEAGLEKYFKETKETLTSTKMPPSDLHEASSSSTGSQLANLSITPLTPFVVVNLVTAGSPADEAGIQVRDKITAFGTITSNNFKDLGQIGELVKSSQNHQVRIKIDRDNNAIEKILVPKVWPGRGLLGCNIVPYSSTQI